jgi:putative intracellular protease/amidase
VWIPLPDRDFDPTEAAVPWRVLTRAGHQVVFATERAGASPACDPRLLSGVIFGKLGAGPDGIAAYREMEQAPAFRRTVAWGEVDPAHYAGLLLPGGHAQGMKQYLGSEALQRKVAAFWGLGRPVGAICHGVLVLARAVDPGTGRSLLHDRRTTCLPEYMERLAHALTFWKLGDYYRTYPRTVEDEVRGALANPGQQFVRGPITLGARGTETDDRPAFVVEDLDYVSARWPGDAWLFARRFRERLERGAPRN